MKRLFSLMKKFGFKFGEVILLDEYTRVSIYPTASRVSSYEDHLIVKLYSDGTIEGRIHLELFHENNEYEHISRCTSSQFMAYLTIRLNTNKKQKEFENA
jgi:hypothetical protein